METEMEFDLQQLEYFIALAEELHFARAAERLGINQSPLSKSITLMERRVGVRLFDRTRRRTVLTPAGRALLPHARRILDEVDGARCALAVSVAGRMDRLCIAVSSTMADPRIGKLLAQNLCEDPQVDLAVMELTLAEQLSRIEARRVDVGFILSASDLPVETDSGIDSIVLWRDPLVLVMRPDHPLAQYSVVQSLEGVTEFVVAGESDLDCGPILDLICNLTEAEYRVSHASIELLLTLVAAGKGVGCIGAAQAETISRSDVVFRPQSVIME